MIYDSIEFHNVRDMADFEGKEGKILCRVPQSLNDQLLPATAVRYQNAACAEMRFQAERLPVDIEVAVYESPVHAAVFFGDHFYESYYLTVGENTIHIGQEEHVLKFYETPPRAMFDPKLIRVLFFSASALIGYKGWRAEGKLVPPRADMLPKRRYVAYGTSITHGFNASAAVTPYCYQAAYRMGADLYNLGAAGCAYMEKGLGEYIAQNYDFDIFTAEVSVNMLNQGYTEQEYYHTTKEFLKAIDDRHPDQLKAVISILPCFWDLGRVIPAAKSTAERYRQITQEVCSEFDGRYLFVDGTELLSIRGLTCDLIHPSDTGMIEIGEKLANRLMQHRPEFFESAAY